MTTITQSREIYLDNSATTAPSDGAVAAMEKAMREYGNPSSLHTLGLRAEKIVEESRERVAGALGIRAAKPGEIIFTSCGTEANRLAICGTVYAKQRRTGNKIITTDSEHPSVENNLRALEADGFRVVRICTRGGVLDFGQFEKELDESVILVTMMMVNNETGALYDIGRAFDLAKKKNPEVITHCDAVQGFMKVAFTPASLHADLVSMSAHKIHGPKGIGALYVNRELLRQKKIVSVLPGGGQESGYRSGTENVIGIAGFGAAVGEIAPRFDEVAGRMASLREYAILKLSALDVRLNIPLGKCAPHIINFTLPSIKSETMLHYLSGEGIYVSSGSACSSHSHSPSRALTAFGLTPADADCSLRVSLSEYNTEDEIDFFAETLRQGLGTLVRMRR